MQKKAKILSLKSHVEFFLQDSFVVSVDLIMKVQFLSLIFPLGILAGFEPSARSQPEKETSASSPSGLSRPKSLSDPLEIARIRSLAEGISSGKRNADSQEKAIATADVPAIIAELLSQAGPSGLSYDVRSEINGMLVKWAKEDFDSALAWASNHPNRKAARDFLKTILREHVKTDYEGTMAVLKTLKENSGINLYLESDLFKVAVKRSALDAFNALTAVSSDEDGSMGAAAEFPPGFDFKAFAELTDAYLKKGENGKRPSFSYYPSNVLKEWAKLDRAAALEFYLSDAEIPFDDLGQITGMFIDSAKPESAYPWLTEQYTALGRSQRSKFAGSLHSVFPGESGIAPLAGLVKSLPTPALQKEMVTDMLKGFGTYNIGNKNNELIYFDLLNLLPTPEERIALIRQSNMDYSVNRVSDQKLSELGFTREQIESLRKR